MTLTWVKQTSGTVPPVAGKIQSSSAGTTILITTSGSIYRSTDGGVTWALASVTAAGNPAGSVPVTIGRGVWFAGTGSSELLKSIDDGATWSATVITSLPSSLVLVGLAQGAGLTVAMYSGGSFSDGYVTISSDGGSTWGAAAALGVPVHHLVVGTGGYDTLSSKFYINGWDGSFNWCIFTSSDAVTWTTNVVESIFTNQPTSTGGGFDNPVQGSAPFIVGLNNGTKIRIASTLLGIVSASEVSIAPPLTASVGVNVVIGDNLASILVAAESSGGSGQTASSTDGGTTWNLNTASGFSASDYFIGISYDPFHGTFIGSVTGTTNEIWTTPYAYGSPVPNVVNEPLATAEADLISAGFTVGVVTSSYDPVIAAGNVISTNPVAGTIKPPGTAIDIVESLGPQPDVIISPTSATVQVNGGTQQFTATTVDSAPVDWLVNGVLGGNATLGFIGGSGLYTAPIGLTAIPPDVTVTARWTTDPTGSASADVAFSGPTVNVYGKYAPATLGKPVLLANTGTIYPRIYTPSENTTFRSKG